MFADCRHAKRLEAVEIALSDLRSRAALLASSERPGADTQHTAQTLDGLFRELHATSQRLIRVLEP